MNKVSSASPAQAQIPLGLIQKVDYDPQRLIWHSGLEAVRSVLAQFKQNGTASESAGFYIYGGKRSGKTHLSAYLSDFFAELQLPVVKVNSLAQLAALSVRFSELQNASIIIDRADQIFSASNLAGDLESIFVDFFNQAQLHRLPVFMLSSVDLPDLEFGDQIKSRLRLLQHLRITSYAAEEHLEIISELASQRAIRLKDSQLDYLTGVLSLEIPQIEAYFDRLYYLATSTKSPLTKKLLNEAL